MMTSMHYGHSTLSDDDDKLRFCLISNDFLQYRVGVTLDGAVEDDEIF